jgi:flagella basal body P-ring formation protein FlgA
MRIGFLLAKISIAMALCMVPFGIGVIPTVSTCLALEPLTKLEIVTEVKADRNRVSLLDLCNSMGLPDGWKAVLGNADIGEAPAIGSDKFIRPDQLRDHLQRFLSSQGCDPSQVELIIPEKITITRQSFRVPKEQIESIYREYILSKSPWNPQDLSIRGIFSPESPDLPAGEMTYEVIANSHERFIGNVSLTIQFYIDGVKERTLRVTGKVELYQNVVHASRPMKKGEVITEADIETQRVNIAENPDRFAMQPDQVIGKRLLRDAGLRQPFNLADLDCPLALKRGKAVTIVYQQPGLKMTAKGQAREDGTIGSTVRVLNVMTNRTVLCRVTDSDTVQAVP